MEDPFLSQRVGAYNLLELPQILQRSGRPEPREYADYAQPDIDVVEGDDAVEVLLRQGKQTVALFQEFGEPNGNVSYAPGKWTVKQVLGHLADDERIFAYRALCVARGDSRPLPGFDENAYAVAARFENRSLADLLADFEAVRHASVTLFRGLDTEAWLRRGIVNGYSASPRGLAFHIAGHELHHLRILRERYLLLLGRKALKGPGSLEGLSG
ncbi:MAG TPA: DinB family protein [Thermoanaerobaculia bacterium]|nr:DinB family protein [Thermoanaerobaculia bacterium]